MRFRSGMAVRLAVLALATVACLCFTGVVTVADASPSSAPLGHPSTGPGGPALTGREFAQLPSMTLKVGTPSAAVPVPLAPKFGSTPTNRYVANWTREGAIAENPSNPLNVVAVGIDYSLAALGQWPKLVYPGSLGIFVSWDGGRTWTDQFAPGNSSWYNSSCGCHTHQWTFDPMVVFGSRNTVYVSGMDGGVGLAISKDGGRTWTSTALPSTMIIGGDKPWLSINPTTGELYLTTYGVNSYAWIANSTDGGQTWTSRPLYNPGRAQGEQVEVDPWGGVDVAWVDWNSPYGLYFDRSSTPTPNFSTPIKLAEEPSFQPCNYNGTHFCPFALPSLAVDDAPASAHRGDLYLTWENGTSSPTFTRVSLSRSVDNGSRWSAPITIGPASSGYNTEPAVAVGPDGTVWVQWYGGSFTNGSYRLYAAASHDGGQSFGPTLTVSDVSSYAGGTLGDYVAPSAGAQGVRTIWVDMRGVNSSPYLNCVGPPCPPDTFADNESFFAAELVTDSLSSNVPVNVSITGTVPGAGTVSLRSQPRYGDWVVGDNFSIEAPTSARVNGTPYYFAEWFGTSVDVSNYLNGTVDNESEWTACYVTVPGAACEAPGAPGVLALSVAPASAHVALDGRNTSLAGGRGNVTLSPGSHSVFVSATGYVSQERAVNITPGNVTQLSVTLAEIPGTIWGMVSPSAAEITVDAHPVPVAANGSFTDVVEPGYHTVNASLAGYAPYSDARVWVASNATSRLPIVLNPEFGTIEGTVAPEAATVTVNGVPVPTDLGSFSVDLTPGVYWVNASLSGYEVDSVGPVELAERAVEVLSLVLTPIDGILVGTVTPADAALTVDGSVVNVSAGAFNVSLPPGNYTVDASASGYLSDNSSVRISPAAVVPLEIALTPATGWIDGTVAPPGARVTVDGTSVSVSSGGTFNVTAPAGVHVIRATSTGFAPVSRTVTVAVGRGTDVNLTLGNTATGMGSFAGVSSLDAALVGAAVAAGAVAAVVIVRKRRTG